MKVSHIEINRIFLFYFYFFSWRTTNSHKITWKWFYVLITSRTRFRVNPHSRVLEYQGTPCPKQARYLKFKWLQGDRNPQPLRKPTLNHLAKLANWLSCVVNSYLCGEFDCMFLSCLCTCFRVIPHSR